MKTKLAILALALVAGIAQAQTRTHPPTTIQGPYLIRGANGQPGYVSSTLPTFPHPESRTRTPAEPTVRVRR